jgi:type I restriction enzyme M protein
LDYTEQSSWLPFLKYLDALEQDKDAEAAQESTRSFWASNSLGCVGSTEAGDGRIDHNEAMTRDDLREFVDSKLFPYLHGFKQRASGPTRARGAGGPTTPM